MNIAYWIIQSLFCLLRKLKIKHTADCNLICGNSILVGMRTEISNCCQAIFSCGKLYFH